MKGKEEEINRGCERQEDYDIRQLRDDNERNVKSLNVTFQKMEKQLYMLMQQYV
jgi:hypothetical protein